MPPDNLPEDTDKEKKKKGAKRTKVRLAREACDRAGVWMRLPHAASLIPLHRTPTRPSGPDRLTRFGLRRTARRSG